MCIIIDNASRKHISAAIIDRSADINKDGYGRIDLRSGQVIRTLNINEARRLCAERIPAVHHFRYATVGGKGIANVHPFEMRGGWWLMMNGTINGLNTLKGESDTACLARMLAENVHHDNYAAALKAFNARFLLAHPEHGTIRVGEWIEHDGVHYSKDNVIPPQTEVLAVYGTLRKGYHNHKHMTGAKFIGKGVTAERHRMYGDGVPFVAEGDERGEGGNIRVEVYEVSRAQMNGPIDSLEGHPNVYTRRKTPIRIDGRNDTIEAWLYFCDRVPPRNTRFYCDFANRRDMRDIPTMNWSLFSKHRPLPACPKCDKRMSFDGEWHSCFDCI
jgi:gamma-glutamylaminecyclotransferase